jgi:hypothetical protein
MKTSFECWPAIVVLALGVGELGLRLSTLQPKLKHCPWREWPRLLWRTMLDDRLCLITMLTAWLPHPSHEQTESPRATPGPSPKDRP